MERNEAFDEFLNECYGTITIAGMTYHAGDILLECDPIAYRVTFNDWTDSQCSDGEHYFNGSPKCEWCGEASPECDICGKDCTCVEVFSICLDCRNAWEDPNAIADPNLISEDVMPLARLKDYILAPIEHPETYEPLEPHFSRGGLLSCDGCHTRFGGDRFAYHGWLKNSVGLS